MVRKNRRRPSPEQERARNSLIVRVLVRLPLKLLLCTLLGVALGVGAYFVARFIKTSPALSIRSIEVRGAQRTPAPELLQAGRLEEGMNIFAPDLDRVERRIADLPWVKRATVMRVIPDRMVVEVEEFTPVALINLRDIYYVDRDAKVFKKVQAPENVDLPLLTGITRQDYQDDHQRTEMVILDALALIDQIRRTACLADRRVAEIHHDELLGSTVILDPGAVSVRLGRERPGDKLPVLCRLLSQIAAQQLRAHTILLDHQGRPGWATVRLDRERVASQAPGTKKAIDQ